MRWSDAERNRAGSCWGVQASREGAKMRILARILAKMRACKLAMFARMRCICISCVSSSSSLSLSATGGARRTRPARETRHVCRRERSILRRRFWREVTDSGRVQEGLARLRQTVQSVLPYRKA
eukprot:3104940-Pleurochrysis_carterae.AAC.1